MSREWFELIDSEVPDRWSLSAPAGPAPHESWAFWAFTAGKRLDPETYFGFRSTRIASGPELDLTFSAFNIPILNARAMQTVRTLECEDLQLIPLTIENVDAPYWIMVVTKLTHCFDWKSSKYELNPGTKSDLRMVGDWYVDDSLISAGTRAFYVAEWPAALIVSDEIRVAIHEAGLTGVAFRNRTPG